MNEILLIVMLLVGLAIGAGVMWAISRTRVQLARETARAESQPYLSAANERIRSLEEKVVEQGRTIEQQAVHKKERDELLNNYARDKAILEESLRNERRRAAENLELLNQAQQKLTDTFKALASEALSKNNASFLELAKTNLETFQKTAQGDLEQRQKSIEELVKPVKESLAKVDGQIQEIEKTRVGAYEKISEQVGAMVLGQQQLRGETSKLVDALKTPNVRGRWGEMQLLRVVQLAGMVEHCDFDTQESVTTDDGRLRPDMVVRLPGGKNIVVDAKVPLAAYLEAMEAGDEATYQQKMGDHARQLRQHMSSLCEKKYWSQFEPTPEFVFLFLPGEIFFSAALQHDPTLIEYGVEKRVIIATPTTLIALLWAVAYGWQQESVAKNAQEIADNGRDLYKRISVLGEHFARLGSSLDKSVEHFNKALGSLETNVLTGARKFKDLHVATEGREIADLVPLEHATRPLTKPELLAERDGRIGLPSTADVAEE